MTITLEAIKAKHTEIAEMIAAFEKQPVAPTFPISLQAPTLKEGEKLIGFIVSADGAKRECLILLPGEITKTNWQDAMKWAASIGGDLPDRCESALLFATMKAEFKPEWYWTNEQHAEYSGYAWGQCFHDGFQFSHYTSYEGRARAVRRLAI